MGTGQEGGYALPRRFDLEIKGFRENVYLARSLVDQATETWSLSEEVRESGRLVLTELTTNAVRLYAGQVIRAWVADPGDGGLELAVWDPGAEDKARLLHVADDAIGGRGLWLVHELSRARWGWYVSESTRGKVVWARIRSLKGVGKWVSAGSEKWSGSARLDIRIHRRRMFLQPHGDRRTEAEKARLRTLCLHQNVPGAGSVVQHRPAGPAAAHQLGVEQHLEVAAHRTQPLPGQRHQLRRALR
jgi:anti-sigma regulatory factor (Ser/Thr protein kinase)